ncbi:MAG: hypothetical protein EXR79_06100 [Myxococcales bacterium]|nr:hypothetical protein [Myxococcales bacterium]
MRPRPNLPVAPARWACLAVPAMIACGSPNVVPAPPPVAPVKEKAPEPDAFRDFRGRHAKVGDTFRLSHKPVAVDGPNVIVALVKTEWATFHSPSGGDKKEATAHMRVQQGEEERAITITQGEARTVFNARLFVVGAGEDYDPQRLVYQAWVDLRADPLEP